MFKWRLYYEDGNTFSDVDGKPWESPPWGVVAIAQPGETKCPDRLIKGDYFLYRADWDCWMETNDPYDLLAVYCHDIAAFRKGRHMRKDHWKALVMQAVNDIDSA